MGWTSILLQDTHADTRIYLLVRLGHGFELLRLLLQHGKLLLQPPVGVLQTGSLGSVDNNEGEGG